MSHLTAVEMENIKNDEGVQLIYQPLKDFEETCDLFAIRFPIDHLLQGNVHPCVVTSLVHPFVATFSCTFLISNPPITDPLLTSTLNPSTLFLTLPPPPPSRKN